MRLNSDLNLHFSDPALLKYLGTENQCRDEIVILRRLFNHQKRINLVLFPSLEAMQRYLGRTVPAWVIATSLADNILILDYEVWKTQNKGTLQQILIHEMVHVILHDFKVKAPLWLNEGLAQYLAGQLDDHPEHHTEVAPSNIYDLNYRNDDVYLISGKIVAKMINIYGLPALIARMAKVADYRTDAVFGEKNINRLTINRFEKTVPIKSEPDFAYFIESGKS